MSDSLDENGLTIKTNEELVTELEDGYKEIYGADINLESNSPDGQVIQLFAQGGTDIREQIQQIYNSFNPDRALGTVLDERVPINNIERIGGSYTIQPILVTVDRALSLIGLDANFSDPIGNEYTVQDDAGTQFILIDSKNFAGAGNDSLNFRAKELGLVETTVDTITNQATVVLGVVSVNNPTGTLEDGENQESDADLKVRRAQSVGNPAEGYIDGLQGSLLDVEGVSEAKVYENVSNVTDGDGIPAHSIWAIVESGANSDIADVIYDKKTPGTGMRGTVVVDITTASGGIFQAKFDRPVAKQLHIAFDLKQTDLSASFDLDAIKQELVDNLIYNIGDPAETSQITDLAGEAIDGGVPLAVEISDDDIAFTDYLEVDTLDEQWTISVADIDIAVI